MKTKIHVGLLYTFLIFSLSVMGCDTGTGSSDPIPATGVTIAQGDTVLVAVGGYINLSATLQPYNSTDTVTWSSSDPSKATVTTSGRVSGIAVGSATISAQAGSHTDTISVTVKDPVPATGITITQGDNATVEIYETILLTATVQPAGSTDPLIWTSSNDAVASINIIGEVTGIAAGTAIITAGAGSHIDTINITVPASAHVDGNITVQYEQGGIHFWRTGGDGTTGYFEIPLFIPYDDGQGAAHLYYASGFTASNFTITPELPPEPGATTNAGAAVINDYKYTDDYGHNSIPQLNVSGVIPGWVKITISRSGYDFYDASGRIRSTVSYYVEIYEY
jgi:hypothetical protein